MNAPATSSNLPGLDLADPALAARVSAGLSRVEEQLAAELHSEFDFVSEAASLTG